MAVYVIGPDGGPYKIGKAEIVSDRLKTLQTGHWDTLVVIAEYSGSYELEEFLHTEFADKRIRNEWFDLSDEDLLRLSKIATAYTKPKAKARSSSLPIVSFRTDWVDKDVRDDYRRRVREMNKRERLTLTAVQIEELTEATLRKDFPNSFKREVPNPTNLNLTWVREVYERSQKSV